MLGEQEDAWANDSTVRNEVGLFWVLTKFRGRPGPYIQGFLLLVKKPTMKLWANVFCGHACGISLVGTLRNLHLWQSRITMDHSSQWRTGLNSLS